MSTVSSLPSLDYQVLLRGISKLPIVEPNKGDVRAPRRRIVQPATEWPEEPDVVTTTTLGHAKSELNIREWDFYTAMMKTELAYALPDDDLVSRSYGAYLQLRGLLKWNPTDLRITQSGVFSRKDPVRSSLAGRFGEALMYLYMVNAGYPFWDHLPSLAERVMETNEYSRDDKLKIANILSRPSRKDGKRVREPDYAFESRAQSVALAEAKGAFVNPGEAPTMVKNGLSEGLEQLELWQKHISPVPQRCFAIGSYLREENDSYQDPSLIAVVDPESEDEGLQSIKFPDDWIRRGNYAAWLRGMGLNQSAELLAYGRSAELRQRTFTTIEVAGREFAATPVRCLRSRRDRRLLLDLEMDFFSPFFRRFDVQVLGIEVTNFRFIEKAVNVPRTMLPVDMVVDTVADLQLPDWFSGSIMPDGTMNAILHFDNGRVPTGTEEFRL
jgi:hypothetical protein